MLKAPGFANERRQNHEGQHALIFCTVEVLLANCLAKALKD